MIKNLTNVNMQTDNERLIQNKPILLPQTSQMYISMICTLLLKLIITVYFNLCAP